MTEEELLQGNLSFEELRKLENQRNIKTILMDDIKQHIIFVNNNVKLLAENGIEVSFEKHFGVPNTVVSDETNKPIKIHRIEVNFKSI